MVKRILKIILLINVGSLSITRMAEPQNSIQQLSKQEKILTAEEISQQLREKYKEQLAPKVPEFIKEIDNVDRNVRLMAAICLGKSFSKEGVGVLTKHVLNDPDKEVRIECAKSLGYIGSKNAIPALTDALNDSEEVVRIKSAISLSLLGEKERCIEILSIALNNENRNIRMDVLHGLKNVRNDIAVSLIENSLRDSDEYVRVDAAIQLTELKEYSLSLPTLRELIKHEDKYIRLAALRGLSNISNDEAIILIKNAMNDKDKQVRERAKYMLKVLGESVDQFNSNTTSMEKLALYTYNPNAAANYADTWWNGRNPAY